MLLILVYSQKRAPALLDNLLQAFLMAPFFVLLEVKVVGVMLCCDLFVISCYLIILLCGNCNQNT